MFWGVARNERPNVSKFVKIHKVHKLRSPHKMRGPWNERGNYPASRESHIALPKGPFKGVNAPFCWLSI